MSHCRLLLCAIIYVFVAVPAALQAQEITLVSYNIENFAQHFRAHRHRDVAATQAADSLLRQLLDDERAQNEEDQWEISKVLKDPTLRPDILALQECCSQADLEYFNRRWLDSAYETIIVFPGNSERSQHLALMLKPGFRIIEKRDQYYTEPDPADPNRRLFARGVAFCLIETPGCQRLWVGVTHQKSRFEDSVESTQWRNRESTRTHQIMQELRRTTTPQVVLLGDMNDQLGKQGFEEQAGADAIAELVGPPNAGLLLVTQKLAESGQISFGGYFRDRHRGFIDHVIVSQEVQPHIREAGVLRSPAADLASDHYPVFLRLDLSTTTATTPPAPAEAR
jgi:endonuclease/exonuclease/phosphatase family metal-dependent hydrolase